MAELDGQVVIVTGSSTGIGAATARACARRGALVVVNGREREKTERVAAGLERPGAHFVADIADPAACREIVEFAVDTFGKLDGIVNNAAVMTRTTLAGTDEKNFDYIISVNLRAPVLVSRAALPHLKAAENASVVNIGSVNAYCGEPNLLAYSISKGGLMTATRNLANAHASDGIRFNQLNVGWTVTENEDEIIRNEGPGADWLKHLKPEYRPSGALLSPENIAHHVVHWLSAESSPISGSIVDLEQYPVVGRLTADSRFLS